MAESASSTTCTPNLQLAEKIAKKLSAELLVPAAKLNEVTTKLANGAATESDWKLWLDLPVMQREAGR